MKKYHLPLLLFVLISASFKICEAQAGQWTWMKGDNTPDGNGNYGMQGVPSSSNEPSSRYACATWTDANGIFWIYGGLNASGDLWKFDPSTLMWTWMTGSAPLTTDTEVIASPKGVYNTLNTPGWLGYGIFTWLTPDGHLWLYGGSGLNGLNSDLWQYNPGTNQWAWMGRFAATNHGTLGTGDTTTMPGGRGEANSAWTDSQGNLWLFGGTDPYEYAYNDVWEYNVSTGIWTWMSGSPDTRDNGVYGTPGVPSVSNYPSGRCTNLFWKDNTGNFWLGGGRAYPDNYMDQDIWKFDPQTLDWTWVKGPDGDDSITIGTTCEADTLNEGGPRYENRADWKICDDLVITFAGYYFSEGSQTYANDMWAYRPTENEWIKINSWGSTGNYGTPGVSAPGNYPPTRFGSVGFKDKDNNVWVFGGLGPAGFYNDLWKYQLDTNCVGACASSPLSTLQDSLYSTPASCDSVCNGTAGVTASGGTPPYYYQWSPTGDTSAIVSHLCAGIVYVSITDANNDSVVDSITVTALAPVFSDSIAATQTLFCSTDSARICVQSAFSSYLWNNADTTICIEVREPDDYLVTVTDSNGCTAVSNIIAIATKPVPLDSISTGKDIFCTNDSTSICATPGFLSYQWNVGDTGYCIFVNQAGDYYVTITDANGCSSESNHISVSTYPVPPVSITEHGDTLSSFGAVSYQWYLNNTIIPHATSNIYVALEPGSYLVEITDSNGCTSLSTPVIITGISEVEDGYITLYPNPGSGVIQLSVSTELMGSKLEIYDAEGRVVFKSQIGNLKSEITLPFSSGIYWLRISNSTGIITRKLVKL